MLPFSVNLKRGVPAHEQILAAVREAFSYGQLRDGDPFPSAQDLAQELRVSPSTAQKVVDQLIEDGFLTQRRGSGLMIRTGSPASWVTELQASQDRTYVAETVVGHEDPAALDGRFPFLISAPEAGLIGLLEDYEVTRLIARGGMGLVFEAMDRTLRRKVAIKVLIPQLAASPEARTRFLREARAVAAIDHENVLPVYGVGESRGFPYLVMPLVTGESLHDRLRREGPLPIEELVRISLAVARGLAAAHQKGLVHRDLKPDNVLLETGGNFRVWLADFGLARAIDDGKLTRTGALAGTPQFTSPEQAEGGEVDLRTDLFSFGALMYTMSTGSPPFEGESLLGVLRKIIEEAPVPPSLKRPDLPSALGSLIMELLEKRPEDRPAGAGAIIARIEAAREVAQKRLGSSVPPPSQDGNRNS